MGELENLAAIDKVMSSLTDDERERALAWLLAKYGKAGHTANGQHFTPPNAEKTSVNATSANTGRPTAKSSAKRAKAPVRMLKDLVLNVGGKTVQKFASDKAPSSLVEKCTVATFYLLHEINLPVATADHVFTFFKHANWPLPADMVNMLQQAGSKGFLDTKSANDIRVTPVGENLVVHGLPKVVTKGKAK